MYELCTERNGHARPWPFRSVQSSYIVPDQTHDPEVMVGQILKIDSENSCPFCVLSNLGNLELSGNTKSTKSFEPNSVLSNFANPEGVRIEEIPRDFFILSDFAKSEVARIEDVCEGIGDHKPFRISKVVRIEDVYEGIWRFLESPGILHGHPEYQAS